MSAEKNLDLEINKLSSLKTSLKSEGVISGRVDINVLLDRARKIKEKETRSNFVFFGLILSLIFVAGMILSF